MIAIIENILWRTRYVMLICVFVSLASAVLISVVSAFELIHVCALGFDFMMDTGDLKAKVAFVLGIIELIDMMIFAGILFIFSFGLYELYIDKLDPATSSEIADRLLNITSIDKLKKKLGHLILMLFVIKLFSYFVSIQVNGAVDFLLLSMSVLMISGALYLTNKTASKSD